eukprot:m51a1_g6145 hypothetical protein (809) ;mRNA; f:287483-290261
MRGNEQRFRSGGARGAKGAGDGGPQLPQSLLAATDDGDTRGARRLKPFTRKADRKRQRLEAAAQRAARHAAAHSKRALAALRAKGHGQQQQAPAAPRERTFEEEEPGSSDEEVESEAEEDARPPEPKRRRTAKPAAAAAAQEGGRKGRGGEKERMPEDDELEWLEQQLGIRKGGRLPEDFKEEGDELYGLLQGIMDDEAAEDDVTGDVDDDDGDKEEKDEQDDDVSGDDAEEEEIPDDDDDDDVSDDDDDGDAGRAPERDGLAVPERSFARAEESVLGTESGRRALRQVKGLLNKVAEANMEPIVAELAAAAAQMSPAEYSEALVEAVLSSVELSGLSGASHVAVLCCAFSVLNSTSQGEHGGFLLERTFLPAYERSAKEAETAGAAASASECSVYVLLVALMYNSRIVHCSVIFDIVRWLVARFGPVEIELLLVLLRNCGQRLRKDDPGSLRDIVVEVQTQAQQRKEAAEAASYSSRVKFILDSIYDLKNNKNAQTPESLQADRLSKLCARLSQKRGGSLDGCEIRIPWKDLCDPKMSAGRCGRATVTENVHRTEVVPERRSKYTEKLLKLARANGMNTDAKRAVFCVLLSSEDYADAFQRVAALKLHGEHEREIASVLLHCCARERRSNPYYSHLAAQLCSGKGLRYTFQLAFVDRLRKLGDLYGSSPRAVANLAELLAHLVGGGLLPLAFLKALDWDRVMDATTVLFFRVFFERLLLRPAADEVERVFRRVAAIGSRGDAEGAGGSSIEARESLTKLKQGVTLFFVQSMTPSSMGALADAERSLLRQRMRTAKHILLSSVSTDVF